MSQRARQLGQPLAVLVQEGATTGLLICLSAGTALFCVYALLGLLHRYPLDYGEAPLVDQAMRLVAGRNIYRPDISLPPYTISNYPPLFVAMLAPLVKLFGPAFWAGRVISILCSLATGVFLSLIVCSYSRDRVAAAVTAMLFWSFPYVASWSALLRIDLLALACSTAGLFLLARWPEARWSFLASAGCLVGAVLTRQSYALAAPAAAFIWLWAQDRRRALSYAGLAGGSCLILLVALNVLTRGGLFYNIVTANVNEFGAERLEWNLRRLCDATRVLLILGGLVLALAPRRFPLWALLAPYLVGAALASLTVGKIGSNVNYFLELCAALSLVAGALLVWSRPRPWLHVLLLVLMALQTGRLMQTTFKDNVVSLTERRNSANELRALERIVADADGAILADEYMGMITLQGRPLFVQPFEVTQLA